MIPDSYSNMAAPVVVASRPRRAGIVSAATVSLPSPSTMHGPSLWPPSNVAPNPPRPQCSPSTLPTPSLLSVAAVKVPDRGRRLAHPALFVLTIDFSHTHFVVFGSRARTRPIS
ncbi:hypothetical protein FA15DRAFT_410415 [Coprinopsis marcescibilis]|uniref:Uncharacterized protein n=1 Tax=Coprinopsis marcescibilis TaxID=230819 RepID=A0A5C3KA05_COPMA|nr:hypothetical protein FA15DRAFT_410415 [Coprinopsis marcescibilis]